jgi:hypothetical protein
VRRSATGDDARAGSPSESDASDLRAIGRVLLASLRLIGRGVLALLEWFDSHGFSPFEAVLGWASEAMAKRIVRIGDRLVKMFRRKRTSVSTRPH